MLILQKLCKLHIKREILDIKLLHTSFYLPKTYSLFKGFNQMLKNRIGKRYTRLDILIP